MFFQLWMKSGKVYAKETQRKTGGSTAVSVEEGRLIVPRTESLTIKPFMH